MEPQHPISGKNGGTSTWIWEERVEKEKETRQGWNPNSLQWGQGDENTRYGYLEVIRDLDKIILASYALISTRPLAFIYSTVHIKNMHPKGIKVQLNTLWPWRQETQVQAPGMSWVSPSTTRASVFSTGKMTKLDQIPKSRSWVSHESINPIIEVHKLSVSYFKLVPTAFSDFWLRMRIKYVMHPLW